MKKKNKKNYRKIKPIGAQVNAKIWNELKVQAIREGCKTGEVLEDAIKLYLQNKKKDIFNLGLGYPLV